MYAQPVYDDRQSFERVGEIFRYTVRPGDHLASIARRFNTTPQLIQGINGLADNAVLQIGQELLIPVLFKPKMPMRQDTYSMGYPAMYY